MELIFSVLYTYIEFISHIDDEGDDDTYIVRAHSIQRMHRLAGTQIGP